MSDDSLNQVLDEVIARLPDHPLDALIEDIKRRPAPYAAVAAMGVAGALLLAARAGPASSGSTAQRIEAQVRSALQTGVTTARRTAQDGAEALKEQLPVPAHEATIADRTRRIAAGAGVSQSTAAVFIGTLLSKAVTGYLRLRAEQDMPSPPAAPGHAQDEAVEQRLQSLNESDLRAIAHARGVQDAAGRDRAQLIDALIRG